MSLKVIGGVYGSRILKSVRGLGTRPLLGQVKAAIFNILGERVERSLVWDLFAGTGSTGIEALSRGARRVVFVEKNGRAAEVIRANLKALGSDAEDRSVVVRGDAWEPPSPPVQEGEVPEPQAPDLVFLDPPYSLVAEDPVKSVYRAQMLAHRLAPGGCLVFHFETGVLDEDDFDPDLAVDLREYGGSAVAFLERSSGVRAREARADEPGGTA